MPTEPHNEQLQLEATIAALESQRGLLGDAVVDVSLGTLRARLAALNPMGGAEPAQQLKQVTILFLDIVGSTTLSQHLDPEDNHGVMDDALARGTAVVQAHHLQIAKADFLKLAEDRFDAFQHQRTRAETAGHP